MSLIGQSWEFMTGLATRTPWGEITLQPLIDDIVEVSRNFDVFLKNGGRVVVQQRVFPLWRSVVLGRHQTPEAYLASIQGRGRQISSWAREIAEKVTCAQQESQLPLVDVLDRDIGLTEVYTTREFYERAATFGLYRCPAEAGLALADQFDDQPQGDYRRIAMEAIEDSGGGLDLFCVSRDEDERWLEAGIGHPQDRWDPGSRWVLTTSKP